MDARFPSSRFNSNICIGHGEEAMHQAQMSGPRLPEFGIVAEMACDVPLDPIHQWGLAAEGLFKEYHP